MGLEFKPAHLKLSDRNPEIRLIEAIRNIPAQRSKLLPLLHQGMEETQAE